MTRRLATRFICAMTILSPLAARAEDVLLDRKVALGAPSRERAIAVRSGEHATVTISGVRHELATRGVSAATVESVALTPTASVGVVRLEGADGTYIALLGGREGSQLLAFGRSDLHGDPGERSAFVLETTERSGSRAIAVGTRHEGLTLCSGRAALTERRELDPASLTLRDAPYRPAAERTVDAVVQAAPPAPPLVRALDALGSSELDPVMHTALRPHALVDGAGSAWRARAFSFASLRGSAVDVPMERLDVTFASDVPRPSELWLLGEGDRVLRVSLPAAGDRASIPLDPAWPNRCLAVVLGAGRDAKGSVGLAELTAYGPLDRVGGVDGLVSQLVRGGDGARDAVSALEAVGLPGAQATATRFAELSAREKRRVLPLLARHQADPAVRVRLLEAVRGADGELAEPALHVLLAAGERSQPTLRELVRDATDVGDRAARALGQDPAELPALLAALAEPGGAARPELRRVIATVAQRHAAAARTTLDAWLASSPPLAARAALGLTLSRVEALSDLALRVVEQASREPAGFEERYRLALAARHAPASSALDGWLEGQGRSAEEWMMRHAAYEALAGRSAEQGTALGIALVKDPYPRVRAAVLADLAQRDAQRTAVAELAQHDGWPLVRVAAVSALAPHRDAQQTLRAALEDSSHAVRSAAIEGLAGQRDVGAWALVRPHLTAPQEWPDVQAAVAHFAAATCQRDVTSDLVEMVRRGLRPDASEDDQALATEAVRALVALGGEAEREARKVAGREGAPPALKRAAEGAATCPGG